MPHPLPVLTTLAVLCAGCALDLSSADQDRDGFGSAADCDDGDPQAFPGAPETCNGRDDDCDGLTDEIGATDERPWFRDRDADGFGRRDTVTWACALPLGFAPTADDCDDLDPRVFPGAPEVCNGADDDCDGDADEGSAGAHRPWFPDRDQDGFGDPTRPVRECLPPFHGYLRDGTDCDDAGPLAAATFPGAAGREPTPGCMQDADNDGWGDAVPADARVDAGTDCDDDDDESWPGAAETCDHEDDDCDGEVDEGLTATWYADLDGDGFGDPDQPIEACGWESDIAADATDCDDGDASVYPGRIEVCDGTDQDCDGEVDEGLLLAAWRDADGDGFGDPDDSAEVCVLNGTWVGNADDCDDRDALNHPGASEWCDGVDNDCDGQIDNDIVYLDWYPDADGDGWGDSAGAVNDCGPPAGRVTLGGDCDDDDASVSPGATDTRCDGIDQDCDGTAGVCEEFDLAYAVALRGAASGDKAGDAVLGVGDVDADGFADLLVGASDNDGGGIMNAGTAYLVLGAAEPADTSLSSAACALTGEALGDHAGSALAAGDVDGDGTADILVGAGRNDAAGLTAGAVYVVLGGALPATVALFSADARLTGEAAGDYAGFALAWAGDVDGDGFGDFVVGAPTSAAAGLDAGAAYLLLGAAAPADGSLAAAQARFLGEAAGDYAGWAVAGGGDVDGDGLDDLLIGAPCNAAAGSYAGAAYLLLGSAAPADLGLSAAEARFTGDRYTAAGGAVAIPGDVDGDGLDDLLIGAPGVISSSTTRGAGHLLLGSASPVDRDPSTADASFTGESSNDCAGTTVAGAGDVDGDGRADLLIGAPGNDRGGSDAGTAYLVLGGSGVTGGTLSLADVSLLGWQSGETAGTAVAGVGDVDADGLDDLLVGAPDADGDAPTSGAAYLVLGGTLW